MKGNAVSNAADVAERLGWSIRTLRQLSGLTQGELAGKCSHRDRILTQSTISKVERGQLLNVETLMHVSSVFGLELSSLIELAENIDDEEKGVW